MTSQTMTRVPVPVVTTLPTASGPVGYIQFNDHIATAEDDLEDAIDSLGNAGITDLILDLRYNGGGYLDMASELSYMVANTTLTAGQHVREAGLQQQEPHARSGHGRDADADAVPQHLAGFLRKPGTGSFPR